MKNLLCYVLHDWTRWQDILTQPTDYRNLVAYVETWRHRECLRCGLKEMNVKRVPREAP